MASENTSPQQLVSEITPIKCDRTVVSESNGHECVICKQRDGRMTAKLGVKGCQGLLTASKMKGDEQSFIPGQVVHTDCRRTYCHPNEKKRMLNSKDTDSYEYVMQSPKTRRGEQEQFDFWTKCFFCSSPAFSRDRKRGNDVFLVRTFDFQNTVKNVCKERQDDWAEQVLGRLEYAQDLPAIEARYHQSCSTNFRTGRQIPSQFQQESPSANKHRKKGRPTNFKREHAFAAVLTYFEENEKKQLTVLDLVQKMTEMCGEEAYSAKYMKQKLLSHFKSAILISELDGKPNVVTFKTNADSILQDFYQRSEKDNTESEKQAIIKTASKLILRDIQCSIEQYSLDEYPSPDDMTNIKNNIDYVPESLQYFLMQLFNKKHVERKIAAIGQLIIQVAATRTVIAPLQLGLGIQMHHQYGSKALIETLNSLGYCLSYSEILRYEACAAAAKGISIERNDNQFVQFVADNVDHNTGTIDGHNTFHGMGMVASVTPKIQNKLVVPRTRATREDIKAIGRVNIQFYNQRNNNMEHMLFQRLHENPDVFDLTDGLDLLIKLSRPLRMRTPGWSGIMQMIHTGAYPGESSIVFMPMIDLNPTDMSCIYSTLHFIARQSREIKTEPVVTFDQPLYWKALTIVTNEPCGSEVKSVVLRLGAFHTEMSFIGSIGRIMENTGLREALETVYAPNTVGHMLNGKAIARAVRGLFLVDDALKSLLTEHLYPELQELFNGDTNNNNEVDNQGYLPTGHVLSKVEDIMNTIISKEVLPEAFEDDEVVELLKDRYADTKNTLLEYRTAKLWIQFMDMVDILKRFIKAERTGNWQFHLKTVQDMLPYFAAAGHNLYLKSGYVYLQHMHSLKDVNPVLHQAFCEGFHVIRRSDRYWAGLSTDLIIEQVLMRSVKSVGGLTRGRGMSESQRAQWLLSMPACSAINNAMQEFTGHKYETSDQHKEAQKSRLDRDHNDRATITGFLRDRNPFIEDITLRNIDTGAAAEKNVNVDRAENIGKTILEAMEGKPVTSYSFKRAHQAVTLGTKNNVRIDGDEVRVDTQLLFQRLMAVSDIAVENTEELFSYELCSHPSSLFDSTGLLREAQKPPLAHAIWDLGVCGVEDIPDENPYYVLDGGSLLHIIPWVHGSTFESIFDSYWKLIEKNYGKPTIVFDGYTNGPSTKDITHHRRTKGLTGPEIKLTGNKPFKTKKEIFLSNTKNKQGFIHLLSEYLSNKGCTIVQADADADVLIAQTAIEKASTGTVVVVGEDTDLLVLLCYYCRFEKDIFFRSDSSRKKNRIWDINKSTQLLGNDMCKILPFVHAFTGCDTTSRIFNIGKGPVLKRFINENVLKNRASVFISSLSEKEHIETAGEEVMSLISGGTANQRLNHLRYRKFVKKVNSNNAVVQVHMLPPTQDATRFHGHRTYHQVQMWLGNDMDPLEWGWSKKDNMLIPIQTTNPPAPEGLLKIIRCNCKLNCDSKKCTCRKHGLHCSISCGDCQGTGCSNIQTYIAEVEDEP